MRKKVYNQHPTQKTSVALSRPRQSIQKIYSFVNSTVVRKKNLHPAPSWKDSLLSHKQDSPNMEDPLCYEKSLSKNHKTIINRFWKDICCSLDWQVTPVGECLSTCAVNTFHIREIIMSCLCTTFTWHIGHFKNKKETLWVDLNFAKASGEVNPLSPNIHIQILQTNLHTFPLRITWENLIKDQGIFPLVIILLILITLSLDNVWILLGENCFWSLLALKGLSYLTVPEVFAKVNSAL